MYWQSPRISGFFAALCLVLVTAFSARPAQAGALSVAFQVARTATTNADGTSMFALHIVPGVGTHGVGKPKVVGFSYGYLGTVNQSVRGVDMGAFTYTADTLFGWQAASVIGMVWGGVTGVQTAGVVALAGDVGGWQAGGAVTVARNVDGAQTAGAVAIARTVDGAQLAGAVGVAGHVDGVQASGAVSVAKSIDGVQLAGAVNVAGRLKGMQLGVINVVGHIESGDAIGLFTFAGNGYNHLSLYSTGGNRVDAALTFGGKRVYTIASVGVDGIRDEHGRRRGRESGPEAVRAGLGWGIHWQLRKRWYIDADLSAGMTYEPGEEQADGCRCDRVTMTTNARLLVGWAPFSRLSVFSGLAADAIVGRAVVHSSRRGESWDWQESSSAPVWVTPKFVLGLRI